AVTVALFGRLGTDIFPPSDAGQLQVRLRAPAGTQIAGTERASLQTLDIISKAVGEHTVAITLAFVGVHAPTYPINLIYLWNGGPEESVVQVQLKPGTSVQMDD